MDKGNREKKRIKPIKYCSMWIKDIAQICNQNGLANTLLQ